VFAKQLAGVGFEQFERIALADLDLGSPDLKRHGPPAAGRLMPAAYRSPDQGPIVARDAAKASASELLARAVRAKGGLQTLRSVRTIKATSTTTFLEGPTPVDVDTEVFIRYPNAFRVDLKSRAGPLIQVFNGGDYWIQDHRGARAASDPIAAQIRGNIQRDILGLLLAATDGKLTATRAADVTDNGRTLPAITFTAKDMLPVTLVLDPDTDLVVAERYEPSPGMLIEEQYSDYRAINGLHVAFRASVRRDGQPFVNRRVRSFEYNVPLDPAIFTKPS
jgi:hypothetical protein